MEPFSEHRDVAAHKETCWCKGNVAQKDVDRQVAQKFGSCDVMRGSFFDIMKNDPRANADPEQSQKYRQKQWIKFTKPRLLLGKALLKKHPLRGKPDPKCEECKGTGCRLSTYNPDAKWDWYVVGGRWDGQIQNKYQEDPEDQGFNFGDEHHQVQRNIVSVKDFLELLKTVPDEVSPFAILTPEGEWVERGEMGWFGIAHKEKSRGSWTKDVAAIVARYPDAYLLGVDCHI
jgi:hypothetical protein